MIPLPVLPVAPTTATFSMVDDDSVCVMSTREVEKMLCWSCGAVEKIVRDLAGRAKCFIQSNLKPETIKLLPCLERWREKLSKPTWLDRHRPHAQPGARPDNLGS
jgi:hypothetical protein